MMESLCSRLDAITSAMTYSRDTKAISELTGEPVSTWSEEWRIETEARTVLKMSKEQRDVFFNGRKDENGKTIDRGVIGIKIARGCLDDPKWVDVAAVSEMCVYCEDRYFDFAGNDGRPLTNP